LQACSIGCTSNFTGKSAIISVQPSFNFPGQNSWQVVSLYYKE
jgi:hypothetical protein